MEKESSPEACSGQIMNWAEEYERLFGRQNSNVKLSAAEQIPPKEIKAYIDDYKEWFERIPERDDTIKKVSALKRVVESWQLNVDVINKMIKYMESTLAVFAVMAICGCQSGLYKVSTSEDGKKIDESVRYCEITSDSFLKESGHSADGLFYDEDRMPIRVVDGQSSMEPDKPGWSGVLWMFSLGIFPMCQSEFMTQAVTVKSPIGERSGTYRVDAKRWSGWIPLFIGYPDIADERDSDAKLPNQRLEGIGKDRLVKNLIGEFSYKDYVAFAKSKNGERKAEIARIKVASEKVDDLLAKNQFDDAITMIANESKPCSASLECDQKSWAGMRDRVTRAHQEFDKKHIQTLIASGRYEDAISFCDSKNSLSGENNDTLKNEALITAVKELKDAKRLIALLKQIKDIGMRDDIVIKLKNLNSLFLLSKEQLVEIANTTSRDDVVLSVIGTINDKDVLSSFIGKKFSANVFKALLVKIADVEAVRAKIWDSGREDELRIYVSVFGSDEECAKLIKSYPHLLTEAVIEELRSKVSKKEMKAEIDALWENRLAAEIAKLDGGDLVSRVKSIVNASMRAKMAKNVLFRLKKNLGSIQLKSEIEHEPDYEKLHSYPLRLYPELVALMSSEDITVEAQKIVMGCKDKIHFEGFYIGMSLQEYYILARYRGFAPDLPQTTYKSSFLLSTVTTIYLETTLNRMVFDRTLRYKMFEKEDGEFWSAFMRKYIPAGKKKSLEEAIGDALDNGTFDYQTNWDANLKQMCYIYTSMKYGTKVIFGKENGILILEEYK